MRNQELFDELVREVQADLDELWIDYHPTVTLNSRLSRTWGQCCYERVNGSYVVSKVEISRNHFMYGNIDSVKDTIMHELLHSNSECVRTNCHHGGEWKRLANYVNTYYPDKYHITRCYSNKDMSAKEKEISSRKQAQKKKYIVTCDCCGHRYIYKRKCKIISAIDNGRAESYKCGHCDNDGLGFGYGSFSYRVQ